MNEDEKWMSIALEQAVNAEKEGEVPVGAILVKVSTNWNFTLCYSRALCNVSGRYNAR